MQCSYRACLAAFHLLLPVGHRFRGGVILSDLMQG
jgi:hypothetical protein